MTQYEPALNEILKAVRQHELQLTTEKEMFERIFDISVAVIRNIEKYK
jgi:hypothetical protein